MKDFGMIPLIFVSVIVLFLLVYILVEALVIQRFLQSRKQYYLNHPAEEVRAAFGKIDETESEIKEFEEKRVLGSSDVSNEYFFGEGDEKMTRNKYLQGKGKDESVLANPHHIKMVE